MPTVDPPKLFVYAEQFYNRLLEQAEPVDSGGTMRFEGHKVAVFRKLSISQGYYTAINTTLAELGCIEQVQRGTSHKPSVVLLHKPPVERDFVSAYQKVLTRPTPLDTLRQQMDALARRLPIEVDLNDFIVRTERRLAALEEREDQGGKDFASP